MTVIKTIKKPQNKESFEAFLIDSNAFSEQ
jgi:hypothetical protein